MISPQFNKEKALRALREAEAQLAGLGNQETDKAQTLIEQLKAEGRMQSARMQGLVLALLQDEFTPITMFKEWACASRIRYWRDKYGLVCEVRNGKIVCKPSEFFACFRALPNESKVGTNLGVRVNEKWRQSTPKENAHV
jgi:hypothetical protein